ncbi:MAG: hypothetical protein WBC18_27205 [Ottowia sp.]|uniref:hypothetical protein n=1 Tax=Ottowia sp. TaxID=1898956 RepID=UPI003C75A33A
MSSLRLGTHALLPTDVELVRMVLRLYGLQGQCQWAYAEKPPYDAVLVEASALEASPLPDTEPAVRHVLHLTRHDTGEATDRLPRPLCPQKLRHWLEGVESILASPSKVVPAPLLAPEPESLPAPAPEPAPAEPEPAFVQALASPAGPASAPEPEPEPLALPPEDAPRLRLQRWPRQGILRNDPDRIRMATLLSRRALNARDLVNLTGFAPHQCQVFMQILQASSLLQPAPAASAAAEAASIAAAPPPARAAKPRFTQGLIAGLRKRLGL